MPADSYASQAGQGLGRARTTCRARSSFRPDRENGPLPRPEHREKVEQLLPRHIFPIQQSHPLRRLFSLQNLRTRIHPLSLQCTAQVARRHSHVRIIPDALRLSRNPDRIDVKRPRGSIPRRIGHEPNGRAHTFPALPECFQIQVFVPREGLQWIGCAHEGFMAVLHDPCMPPARELE
jgi:hypothetical protein